MRIPTLLLLFAAIASAQPPFDVLIRGGRIFDGSGGPWYVADVAIRGDSIAAIGHFPAATAARVIDARGFAVSPGFLDIHTHARRGIFQVPTAENYLRQGVTTLIEGPDGSSPLPLAPFLEKVKAAGTSVNFGSMVGQGTIRQAVVGLADRKATPEEIARMKELARQAMRDGAFGLSTGLFYVPGNYTPTEEIVEIAKVVGESGGIHISHMRNEAIGILESVRETIRIGEEGHLPTQITHHKIIGKSNWGKSAETLALVDAARARGVDVTIDQYPYTASSTGISALFPRWALAGGHAEVIKRLHDSATRARIKAAILDNIRNDRGGGDAKNVVLAGCPFDASLAGKSLAQIGSDPAEAAMDLEERGGCSTVYHAIDEADVERILRYPFTMIGSDGEVPIFGEAAPHPRSYGTFVRVLGYYARDRKVITMEDAVRRMTSLTANRLGLTDRGILRPGMKADVVVFDPERIGDRATFEKPHQYAAGVKHVFVNGRPAILDGSITAERPGRILYGPAATSPQ